MCHMGASINLVEGPFLYLWVLCLEREERGKGEERKRERLKNENGLIFR